MQNDAVSLFRLSAQPYGTMGLITHNYLAGEHFFNLRGGPAGWMMALVSATASRLYDARRRSLLGAADRISR